MILEFPSGYEIKDDNTCNNCKWNVGYSSSDYNIIWCDKHLRKVEKYSSCKNYIFRLK